MTGASATELRAIGYSAGNLGKNLLWSAADLTLLFILTDILGLPPGFAGTVMMLALVGDMVIDLGAGRLAAAAERFGIGYHHMLWLFAPACAASFALLYALAGEGGGDPAAIVLALVAFRVFYGLLDIPHNAMMPHVVTDSRARGRVSGYRYIFSSLATLLVTLWLAPQVSAASLLGQSADLETFGIVAAGLSVLTLWIAASCFRAPDRKTEIMAARVRILPRFSADYTKLLVLGLLAGGASAMFARSMIYYGTHYLADAGAAARILTALVVGQLAGTILWSTASQRFDSRHVLASANAASAILVPGFLLLPPDLQPVGGFLIGAALAGVFALPWAILSDIIDADDVRFGRRYEPQAVSLFVTVLKGGAAIGIAAMGWTLDAVGYDGAGSRSPAISAAVLGLTIIPATLGGLAASAIAWSLKGGHASHARHIEQLAARRSAGPRTDNEIEGDI